MPSDTRRLIVLSVVFRIRNHMDLLGDDSEMVYWLYNTEDFS